MRQLLDARFGGARAGADANGLCAIEPCGIDIVCAVDDEQASSLARAVSARRVELEEFFEPTMRTISERSAISGNGVLAIGGRVANALCREERRCAGISASA